jgi:hypothetical protein
MPESSFSNHPIADGLFPRITLRGAVGMFADSEMHDGQTAKNAIPRQNCQKSDGGSAI